MIRQWRYEKNLKNEAVKEEIAAKKKAKGQPDIMPSWRDKKNKALEEVKKEIISKKLLSKKETEAAKKKEARGEEPPKEFEVKPPKEEIKTVTYTRKGLLNLTKDKQIEILKNLTKEEIPKTEQGRINLILKLQK